MWQLKDFAHHLLFPRESNNHRAKLLHHKSLLILIAGLLLGSTLLQIGEREYPQVLGISHTVTVEELLVLTNQKRSEAGLPPLQLNAELSQAAAGKAQDMFLKDYWAHTSPDGLTPWVFIKDAGYDYVYAGENLARGFTSAEAVVNAWMASPGHKDNLLSKNYKEIGFAIQTGSLGSDDTVLVVQEFGSRTSPTAEKTTTTVAAMATPQPTVPVVAGTAKVPTPTIFIAPTQQPDPLVASVGQNSLINTKSLSTNVSIILIAFLVVVLALDLWVVEKRKIVRAVAHNMDHIIFLGIVLAAIILFSKGSVL